MKGIDKHVNCFLNGTEEDGPYENIFSVINLCENSDLQAYDEALPREKVRVNQIISSIVNREEYEEGKDRIEDKSYVIDGSCSLIDIEDDLGIDDFPIPYVNVQMQECILHDSGCQMLHDGHSKHHYFFIQDDPMTKLKSLTLTVVYHGSFDGPKYDPGNLSVKWSRVTNNFEQQTLIGNAPPEPQVPNTKDNIGRIIIQHELNNFVIQGGLFKVEVTAKQGRDVSYSVTVGGRMVCPLMKEVKLQMANLIAKRHEKIDCIDQTKSLENNLLLLERKKSIVSKLLEQTKKKYEFDKAEMEKLDLELDKQDEMKESMVQQIIQKIGALKLEIDASCRLSSLRSRIFDGISSDIEYMAKEKTILQHRMQKLKKEVDDSEILLTRVSSRLWGHQASAKIMSQLG
ncbi:hypothetical protein ACHAW5_006466 [Stephanodiscus triporus]|uniref:Uncharacterized protein n=1 Tax=Stephanodiscus triporus TaxID=2934178 RepID=A0ABD3NXR9_9STRA